MNRFWLHRLSLLGLLLICSAFAWYLDPASHAAAQATTHPAPPAESSQPRDCGVESVVYGKGNAVALRECLWQAYVTGVPAHFESRATLVGSTIIYRVQVEPGQVIFTVDQTQSLYAPREAITYVCTSMARLEMNGALYFTLHGCPTLRALGL